MKPKLVPYRVNLYEEKGDKLQLIFDTMAEDSDGAADQAEQAYPGCEVINCVEFEGNLPPDSWLRNLRPDDQVWWNDPDHHKSFRKKSSRAADAFVTVTTVHQAEVAWWWTKEKLHDTNYQIKVNESVGVKIKELETTYGISDDTRYCCQWEGKMLVGDNRDAVMAAATELATYLQRFKDIVPLSGYGVDAARKPQNTPRMRR